MTQDDCSDLLFVTGKLTSPNPHFDSMRAGIQVLMGLLAGISSDGVVSPTEAEHLQRWLEAWSHLKGLWPYDECEAIVTASLSGGHDVDSLEYLVGLSEQFPVAGSTEAHGDHLPAVIAGVCAVDPTITFPNRTFVVTGESARCQRAEMEAQIQIRHGLAAPRVTRATDYLIVCDGGNPHWAFACYGRKVEQAYTLRRAGQEIVIVHEIDFWDALAL